MSPAPTLPPGQGEPSKATGVASPGQEDKEESGSLKDSQQAQQALDEVQVAQQVEGNGAVRLDASSDREEPGREAVELGFLGSRPSHPVHSSLTQKPRSSGK